MPTLACLFDCCAAREVLRERGVGEGPATEKSELVEWVFTMTNSSIIDLLCE